MKILEIYKQYQIPKNLQRHMLCVAAVGQYIGHHWQEPIDLDSIIEALLLHDLGNLLKFNLNQGLEFFDEDERDLEYWIAVQAEMKDKYTQNEHVATQSMVSEIGVSRRVQSLLENMGSANLHKTVAGNDWELKIAAYADFRVGPTKFLSVVERFDDILDRYEGNEHELADRKKTLVKRDLCLQLEKQLIPHISVSITKLPAEELQQKARALQEWEVEVGG